jgi:hypothetical protein
MAKHVERVLPNIDIQIERWPIARATPQANNPRNCHHSCVAGRSVVTMFGLGQRPSRQSKFVHDPLCTPGEVA